jgi:hypothetical protein
MVRVLPSPTAKVTRPIVTIALSRQSAVTDAGTVPAYFPASPCRPIARSPFSASSASVSYSADEKAKLFSGTEKRVYRLAQIAVAAVSICWQPQPHRFDPEVGFAMDSALEGSGFEPPVPACA